MRKTVSLLLAAATLAGSLGSAQALPLPAAAAVRAEVAAGDPLRQDVQYYYRRHYYRGGDVAVGVVGGLAAGALIAGAIASSQAAQPLHRTQDPDYIAYCSRKYRSFDPQTGTYLARDGYRYACE
ncbi:BA14K family protein [Salinarimonas soli]|uniref:Lectin-like protein BA14k n=1 Tax=Salinarimonas soli TaxID=1638099 RepID=A0A5B2VCC9_9HYPH|nr:BA14K family protein [Salinarimonas soli]KAA2236385.1 BA14K family protein [Salinarimonas soli]